MFARLLYNKGFSAAGWHGIITANLLLKNALFQITASCSLKSLSFTQIPISAILVLLPLPTRCHILVYWSHISVSLDMGYMPGNGTEFD